METQQTTFPRFIRVSQFIMDFYRGDRPLTRALVLTTAEDLGYMDRQQHLLMSEGEPVCLSGCGVYAVNEDDTLTLIKDRFDTSG